MAIPPFKPLNIPPLRAEILNIYLKKGKKIYPLGIGGHVCAYIHNVKMKVGDVEFETDVLISDELIVRFNILGRIGIFDNFKVCFDDKKQRKWNVSLPAGEKSQAEYRGIKLNQTTVRRGERLVSIISFKTTFSPCTLSSPSI